ncbi:hypothetical protein LVJ82_11940 [Vitreoscilla massiliensis]|uniref:Uncharacterized protein n=1 Tax=Vitreoscilla massiliensis TaxID=1689272 RepID=A0ABY4DXF0_9NEIS|nr:hypothetical protein [Vitreoscilla massiliensis]UOO88196.1 hypothetical protein LVJ82_11940 [Vitreoscilla massiliensis]
MKLYLQQLLLRLLISAAVGVMSAPILNIIFEDLRKPDFTTHPTPYRYHQPDPTWLSRALDWIPSPFSDTGIGISMACVGIYVLAWMLNVRLFKVFVIVASLYSLPISILALDITFSTVLLFLPYLTLFAFTLYLIKWHLSSPVSESQSQTDEQQAHDTLS